LATQPPPEHENTYAADRREASTVVGATNRRLTHSLKTSRVAKKLSRERQASGSPLLRQWSETLRVCRAARLYYSRRAHGGTR